MDNGSLIHSEYFCINIRFLVSLLVKTKKNQMLLIRVLQAEKTDKYHPNIFGSTLSNVELK